MTRFNTLFYRRQSPVHHSTAAHAPGTPSRHGRGVHASDALQSGIHYPLVLCLHCHLVQMTNLVKCVDCK